MRYITDRKRANAVGSAHAGTAKHWFMQVTAIILAILLPIFIYLFGSAIGMNQAGVAARFGNPFAALLTAT
ncbi:MAG: succinate dehydrogenase, partial [Paracoccaceae bacterium]